MWFYMYHRCTSPSKRKPTAKNARNTKCIRYLSTKKERTHSLSKEKEGMMQSKRASEVRLNPSSRRRLRLLRKSLWNLSVVLAREEDYCQLRDASLSLWVLKIKSQMLPLGDQRGLNFNKIISNSILIIYITHIPSTERNSYSFYR